MGGPVDEDSPQGWFPAAGPLSVPCKACRAAGNVAVEHRVEFAQPPRGGWPRGVDALRVARSCRGCGSDFLSFSRRLVAAVPLPREMPWVTCEQCGRSEAGRLWPWAVCGRCDAEDRARPLRPPGA